MASDKAIVIITKLLEELNDYGRDNPNLDEIGVALETAIQALRDKEK